MADSPGTWFRALLARTSWKVRPGNSGTWTLRSRPRMLGMPGSAEASSRSSRCASHRMAPCEHMFDALSRWAAGGSLEPLCVHQDAAMEVLSSRVLLRPTDPERSRAFYGDVLGLAVYREFGPPEDRGVVHFLGNGLLEISGRSDDPPRGM